MTTLDYLEKIDDTLANWEDYFHGQEGTDVTEARANLGKVREQLLIGGVIERFSGENLQKLQKHFVNLYGSDEMAQEKANSFAVGFGKACELIIKDLNAL